jgi:two-component system sensor histidine kinase MtrB
MTRNATMNLDLLFSTSSSIAMLGWLALVVSLLLKRPFLREYVAKLGVPLVLSAFYAALIVAYWGSGKGGFDSLDNVALLFESRGELDPPTARSAELLQTQLDRFESLLADLLEISRYDAGAAVLELETIDLAALVRRAVDSARPLADRRGSAMSVSLLADPCPVECDPRRVDRILRNLIDNAIEHGEGRPIEVTVQADGSAAAVTVRDHGVGLSDEDIAQVFNRFWRADPARARTTGGTGLGLSIAMEDTRLHAGWLEAWGVPDEGACFRLTLPCRADVILERSPLPLVTSAVADDDSPDPVGLPDSEAAEARA